MQWALCLKQMHSSSGNSANNSAGACICNSRAQHACVAVLLQSEPPEKQFMKAQNVLGGVSVDCQYTYKTLYHTFGVHDI